MSTPPLAHETDVFRQRARLMLAVTARAWGLEGCRMPQPTPHTPPETPTPDAAPWPLGFPYFMLSFAL